MEVQSLERDGEIKPGSDYTCARCKSNPCKEMTQNSPSRTGCNDYTCARCKPKPCKEMTQNSLSRTGCNDYTCARCKSNHYKKMVRLSRVPFMHAPGVSPIVVRL